MINVKCSMQTMNLNDLTISALFTRDEMFPLLKPNKVNFLFCHSNYFIVTKQQRKIKNHLFIAIFTIFRLHLTIPHSVTFRRECVTFSFQF